jgi:DNA-binding transcriptional regulator YiaG
MKQKYKSELLEVIYEDALASFRVGAISEERLREYAEDCLVPEAPPCFPSGA